MLCYVITTLRYVVYLFKQISDEGRFAGGILSDEQHHRLSVEVWIVERRGMKVVEFVEFFERQHLLLVQLLQAVCHRREGFRFLLTRRVLA